MTSCASWQLAARHLALDAAAVAAIRALEEAAVDALLLKGPVTASRLYPDEPERRSYGDVDILVCPRDFARAETALGNAGYRRAHAGLRASEVGWQEASWFAPGADRLGIDLHRSLHRVTEAETLWWLLWADRTSMVLQARDVAVPNRAGSVLILALHASSPGTSWQPYRDLARAIEMFDDTEWASAIELARRVGAVAGVAAGLDAVPAARPMLERHNLSAKSVPTAMRMFSPETSSAGLAIRTVLLADGWRARVRYLTSRALPSEAAMHKNWPVRKPGSWGLMQAHGQRYRQVVRTLPQGLAELRRAWRGGRSDHEAWASQAVDDVRHQLAHGGLDSVDLHAPATAATARQVARALQGRRASCLEGSLVRQRFYAARGDSRSLVIGVSQPGERFHAHAWLVGDPEGPDDLYEILRRPVPAEWVGQPRATR